MQNPLYASTPEEVVRKLVGIGKIGLASIVYDIGAGDGRIAIEAAKLGAQAVAIEHEAAFSRMAQCQAEREGVSIKILVEDANLVDYGDATHIICTLPASASSWAQILATMNSKAKVMTIGYDVLGLERESSELVNIQGSIYDLSLSLRNFEDVQKLYPLTVQELVEKMPTRLRYFWAGPLWYDVRVHRKVSEKHGET